MPYHFSPEVKAAMRQHTREFYEQFYMNKPQPQITMEDAMLKPVKTVKPMRKPEVGMHHSGDKVVMNRKAALAPPKPTVTGKKAKPVEPRESSKEIIIEKALALLKTAGKDGVKFSVLIEKILAAHKDLKKNTVIGTLVVLNSDPRISKPSRGLYVLKG